MNNEEIMNNSPEIIEATSNFIGNASTWGMISFSVYITLFLATVITLFLYINSRHNNRYTQILLDVQKDSTIAITNNTTVSGKILDLLRENETLIKLSLASSQNTESKASINSDKMDRLLINTEKLIAMIEQRQIITDLK